MAQTQTVPEPNAGFSQKGGPAAVEQTKTRKKPERKVYANPRERWLGLGSDRVSAVVDAIRVLGHCANSDTYEFQANEVTMAQKAIDLELAKVFEKFENVLKGTGPQLRKKTDKSFSF